MKKQFNRMKQLANQTVGRQVLKLGPANSFCVHFERLAHIIELYTVSRALIQLVMSYNTHKVSSSVGCVDKH